MSIKAFLMEFVVENPGIQAVELVTKLTIRLIEEQSLLQVEEQLNVDVIESIEEAVKNSEIIELEYLTLGSNRLKSRYFPAGTTFNFLGTK